MALRIEGYRRPKEQDFFNDPQKKVIVSWACGFETNLDIAAHQGLSINTIKRTASEIFERMSERVPGTDHKAKAVTMAALKGWINPALFPNILERRLTEREVLVLTYRSLGLTRNEVSRQFTIEKKEVAEAMGTIIDIAGAKNDYGAIAWAILKALKNTPPPKEK